MLWRLGVTMAPPGTDAAMGVLEAHCISVSAFENEATGAWRVEGLVGSDPDRQIITDDLGRALGALGLDFPALDVDLIPPQDWTVENLMTFPPLRIARYFVHGSHVLAPPPAGAIALMLDAGTAFGSGEHPTTATCLRAIDRLALRRRPARVLDMGCGSGILAIAAVKLYDCTVLAVDIDEASVEFAR